MKRKTWARQRCEAHQPHGRALMLHPKLAAQMILGSCALALVPVILALLLQLLRP